VGATLATLIDRVQTNFGETGTAYTTEAEIRQWIQEAHDRLADTGYIVAQATTDLVANQENYDITTATATNAYRIIRLVDVQYLKDGDTTWHKLQPAKWEDIRAWYDSTESTAGTWSSSGEPAYYCWYGAHLYLYPVPSYDETGGLQLTFMAAQLLDEDTDTTRLPREYEVLPIDYAIAQWCRKDGRADLEQYYMARFMDGESRLKSWLRGGRDNKVRMISMDDTRLVP